LTDRGTYLALRESLDLAVVLEGAPDLLNIYHVMEVNPRKFPAVNHEGAAAFGDFMVSPETQEFIRTFGVARFGQALFTPRAGGGE
jgi:tungstate transport system substrate-binding protein